MRLIKIITISFFLATSTFAETYKIDCSTIDNPALAIECSSSFGEPPKKDSASSQRDSTNTLQSISNSVQSISNSVDTMATVMAVFLSITVTGIVVALIAGGTN